MAQTVGEGGGPAPRVPIKGYKRKLISMKKSIKGKTAGGFKSSKGGKK